MIQVWVYDENKIFIEIKFVEEVAENMTIVPLLVGYIKPTFDEVKEEWYEGATEEEIKEWEEANKPEQEEASEIEVLEKKVEELQKENKLLRAQVGVLSDAKDFHEELIAEMAMKVYA